MASERLRPFGIDLSLAPTLAVGGFSGPCLEEMGWKQSALHGTTAALALPMTKSKKAVLWLAIRLVVCLVLFIPVSEDEGMIAAVQNGSLNLEKLEAMTAICSVGLDCHSRGDTC